MVSVREIKQSFMAFRNGIVADALRKAGMDYEIIFGLQIPQLSGIANTVKESAAGDMPDSADAAEAMQKIASELWDDRKVRESRLLACYLFQKDLVDNSLASRLAGDVMTREEADILSFRLLRHLPFANALADQIEKESAASENPIMGYCAEALRRNLA